ncbi:Hypothetical predicted protein, partial [Marmota monax]
DDPRCPQVTGGSVASCTTCSELVPGGNQHFLLHTLGLPWFISSVPRAAPSQALDHGSQTPNPMQFQEQIR